LYSILIESGIPMKLVRLIKMHLNEMFGRVWVGQHLSDMFPVKNGLKQDVSLLLFNFALEYAIRRVQVNQGGLKLNGTHLPLVYADDVNIMGRSIHTIKKNTKDLVVASMVIGLQVTADKTKYLVISRSECRTKSRCKDW